MKRIIILGILAYALVILHTDQLSLADKKQSTNAAKWESVTFKSATGDVEVKVLRIWDSPAGDPKWPQLALLRLPPAAYKELRKDSDALKAFIDGTQTGKPIFDAPVTITEACKLPEPGDRKSAEGTDFIVLTGHRTSRVSCTTLEEQAMPQ